MNGRCKGRGVHAGGKPLSVAGAEGRWSACVGVLLVGALGLGTVHGQTGNSQAGAADAQVEANVLRALAGAPELADEAITTHTVFGVVTLSGTVRSEEVRTRAENLAAESAGVKKVVDELQIVPAATDTTAADGAGVSADGVLQSDGTYTPAAGQAATRTAQSGTAQPLPGSAPAGTAQRNDPDADQVLDQAAGQEAAGQGGAGTAAATSDSRGSAGQTVGPAGDGGAPGTYGRGGTYPSQGRLPYPPNGYPSRGSYDPRYGSGPAAPQQGYDGQVGGQAISIPAGTMVRIRLNHTLASDRSQAGSRFDATVVNDVVAGGAVAIPRGATVGGTVLEARSSGVLKGRGELSAELTDVTLGGRTYPLVSDVWAHHSGDKTIETVNKTAGFGAAGAVIGALAGGGVGAAVGGGIGAAAGLGSSAASGNGQVVVPVEGVMTFHLAQQAAVTTVSEQEMQRLAYAVAAGGPGEDPRLQRRRRVYPPVYFGGGPYWYGPRARFGYPYPYPYGYPYPY